MSVASIFVIFGDRPLAISMTMSCRTFSFDMDIDESIVKTDHNTSFTSIHFTISKQTWIYTYK